MANKAEELLTLFKEKGWTLGSVESMTAGLFGATICSVPGASKVYRGGIISYHPGVKVKLAEVSQKDIDTYGVVSKEIAKEMAEGGRKA
jgi:PncC family amidohydrolase